MIERWLRFKEILAGPTVLLLLFAASMGAQEVARFTCGQTDAGAKPLSATTIYAGPSTFGFDLKTAPANFSGGACSGEGAFFFSIPAADGNYEVTVDLGGSAASTTTVRAESRRLMVEQAVVAAGGSRRERFVVNVRTPEIDGGQTVNLKPRELGALDWDGKLTLEFNGVHPSVRSIAIRRVEDVPTIYLAGDSTVVDQDKEPWAAWGQMLPRFFDTRVAVANEAESGETIRSFVEERRLAKVMSTMKRGDYLLMQFAHNDQKPGAAFVSIPEYKALLLSYIEQTRARGATPMLVTSMNRRRFDAAGQIVATLGEYPETTRQVAAEQKVALIDLNAMSRTLFEAMGEQGTLKAFVHYPAGSFPGQDAELKDDTHFTGYGAYELARCVVESIRAQGLPMAVYLRKDAPVRFNPAHPDAVAAWSLPVSPLVSTETPYGR